MVDNGDKIRSLYIPELPPALPVAASGPRPLSKQSKRQRNIPLQWESVNGTRRAGPCRWNTHLYSGVGKGGRGPWPPCNEGGGGGSVCYPSPILRLSAN